MVGFLIAFLLSTFNSDALAQPVSRPVGELDAAMTCAPLREEFVYRCSVRIIHRQTKAPLCVHRGSISFAMPPEQKAKVGQPPVQSINLKTDTNGEMKDLDVKLETLGIWSIAIKAGDEVIQKSIEVRSGGIKVR